MLFLGTEPQQRVTIKDTSLAALLRSRINHGPSGAGLPLPLRKLSSVMHDVFVTFVWRAELGQAFPKRKQMSLSGSSKTRIYGTSNLLPRAANVPFLTGIRFSRWIY